MHIPGMGHISIDDERLGSLYSPRVATRLFSYLRPHKRVLAMSILAMLVSTGATIALPWVVKQGIDTYIGTRDLAGLDRIALLFGGLALLSFAASYIHLRTLARISQSVLYQLRTDMFDHLQRLSLSFFDRHEVGRVMSRVQNDVQHLQEFISVLVISIGDLLGLVGIVIAMLLMNTGLALITLAVIPPLFVIMVVWQRYARRSFLRVRRALAMVNAGLQENISGVRVAQSFTREDANIRRFDQMNYAHLDANLQASRLSSAILPAVELLTSVALGLVVVFGGGMVLQGTLEVGVLVAFILYIQRFFDPVRNLTLQYTQFQQAMTSGERIVQLLETQPEVADAPDAVEMPPIRGEVRYEEVSFAYTTGVPVLQKINLLVRPGERLAIVGPTGAGKSTLVSLLMRFYDVSEGRMTVDGLDIRKVRRQSLVRQIGVVLQEPFLFSGTVLENIRYNHPGVSEEEVTRVARAVGAHQFIERLPQGYATVLQERGGNLSMGQRQLLAFARALVADPRVIILDEATANVDPHTEEVIQEALKELLRGRTALVIAHRLSTVYGADRIVVLDGGRIVEEGTHKELLSRGGLYARLHAMNTGNLFGEMHLPQELAEKPAKT